VAAQEPFGGIVEHAEYVAALPRVDQRRVTVAANRAVFADLVAMAAAQVDAVRKRGVVAQRAAGRPPHANRRHGASVMPVRPLTARKSSSP
jgi:hypothetical protein